MGVLGICKFTGHPLIFPVELKARSLGAFLMPSDLSIQALVFLVILIKQGRMKVFILFIHFTNEGGKNPCIETSTKIESSIM